MIIIKFEYEIGNVDYDDFLLELKSIYSMLKGQSSNLDIQYIISPNWDSTIP